MSTPTIARFSANDGTELALYIYRPGHGRPAPVALSMTPYTATPDADSFIPALLSAGYVFVAMDVRGTGCSGGEFLGPLSPREIDDAVEVIDWLAEQEFCDGQVALVGPSYLGANQFLVAARQPQALRCIAPAVAPIDFYRDWTHRGGIPSHQNWAADTFLARPNQPSRSQGPALAFYNAAMLAVEDGPLFRERSPEEFIHDIRVPVFLIGGLHDFFRGATLRAFESVRTPKKLLMGPWGHGASAPQELIAWLDHWTGRAQLTGVSDSQMRWWILGREEWIDYDPDETSEVVSAPLPEEIVVCNGDPLIQPPASPTTDEDLAGGSGLHLWAERQRVVIDTPGHGVVRGCPVAELSLRVDGWADADLYIRLSVAEKDSPTRQLTEGRLRLSQRAIDTERSIFDERGRLKRVVLTHKDPSPVPFHTDFKVAIELLPTCFELAEGSQLVVGFDSTPVGGLMPNEGELRILPGSSVHLPFAVTLHSDAIKS
ncbi:CocE/NonD family hydrolase [Paenarthrobacter sp. NPDC091669]|uniref:CocE/NonD family hydrolase n=1 Tax=Paenarthrobacter sp. NPDC091669 TaxID=3364384 RepID=UPI00381D4402